MKKLLVFLMLLSGICHAQRYDISVNIGGVKIYDTDNTINEPWRGAGFIELPDIAETPNCGKSGTKYIATFSTSKSELLSAILAAKMADKTVLVTIDDTVKYPTGDFCVIQFFRIK